MKNRNKLLESRRETLTEIIKSVNITAVKSLVNDLKITELFITDFFFIKYRYYSQ